MHPKLYTKMVQASTGLDFVYFLFSNKYTINQNSGCEDAKMIQQTIKTKSNKEFEEFLLANFMS